MARNRVIRPEFWNDEKLATLKRDARLLFIGLWTISDDYGTVRSNHIWIKNQVFPYDEDLRAQEVKAWLDTLVSVRMLEPFNYNGEGFYNIRSFNSYQKVDNPSRPTVPLEIKARILNELENGSRDPRETLAKPSPNPRQEEKRSEEKRSNKRANALSGAAAPLPDFSSEEKQKAKEFQHLQLPSQPSEAWKVVKAWIEENKPQFIEPYVTAWNIFASVYHLPEVKKIHDPRRRKFATRIKEQGFEFFEILARAKQSEFLKSGTWFNFDWIIENQMNYTKILEGQYK